MKRITLRVALFIAISFTLTSCEGILDNCKVCQLNTYESGLLAIEGAETEYCDDELIAILAIRDVVDGQYTYKWECR